MDNFYWQIYKDIESEVLSISKVVAFCDSNIKTCSIFFGNIILRCSVEIESISKEIYTSIIEQEDHTCETSQSKDIYFDTDCLKKIEDMWETNKKELEITAVNTSFTSQYRRIKPLHKASKRGSRGSKWKQAYQEVKHNRKNSLVCSNLSNVLNALGALYLLNLYYLKDEESFELNYYKSKIFSFDIFDLTSKDIKDGKYQCVVYDRDEISKALVCKCWKKLDTTVYDEDKHGHPSHVVNILTTTGILEMIQVDGESGSTIHMNHLEKIYKINKKDIEISFESIT